MKSNTNFNYPIRTIRNYLIEPLKKSTASKYYYFLFEEYCDESTKALLLDGKPGEYAVDFLPYVISVYFGDETFQFYNDEMRFKTPGSERDGHILFNESNDQKTPEEILGQIYEILFILGGAKRIYHTDTSLLKRDHIGTFKDGKKYYADIYNYDVFVDKDDTEPYIKKIDNVTFHVNCDLDDSIQTYTSRNSIELYPIFNKLYSYCCLHANELNGVKSLNTLKCFIDGYIWHECKQYIGDECRKTPLYCHIPFEQFEDFLKEKYSEQRNLNWALLIETHEPERPWTALSVLLEEFKKWYRERNPNYV